MKLSISVGASALLVSALLYTGTATAQSTLEERLYQCRAIESALERLDCYDNLSRESGELRRSSAPESSASERSEPVQAEPQQAQTQSQDNDFGREHRRQPAADDDGKRYVEIVEKWQNPRGLWRFRLADGAEWHQTEASQAFSFDDNADYYIERGMLNSFRLSHDNTNRSIRVRRAD